MDTNQVVDLIKKNDRDTIQKVYMKNKLSFFKIVNRYQIPEEIALDIYQDSIVALIENARKNSIDHLKSSIDTYFIGISKFMIFNYLKSKKTISLDDYDTHDWISIDDGKRNEEDLNNREKAMKKAYENLGEQCQKIIGLFYFEEKKLEEIQLLLKYESKDVLKSQKSRCLSHLKKFMNVQ
jgi:RNA polymerase sigma factor (sigma-70 family)